MAKQIEANSIKDCEKPKFTNPPRQPVPHNNEARHRVSGTLSIENFWRAIDGEDERDR